MANNNTPPSFEEVYWKDIRSRVLELNPSFAAVIDQLDPDSKMPLYIARYPFGSTIVREGIVHIPIENKKTIAVTSSRIPTNIQAQLNYTGTIPAGIVLSNSTELFMKQEDATLPFTISTKGRIIALWRALDPDPTHSFHAGGALHMVAGTRTLFMLPKITDTTSFKKLSRARGINLPLPISLFDHGPIFEQMSQHKDFTSEWETEILFFSAEWFKRRDDIAWLTFHHFLLEDVWGRTQFWRNKIIFDYIWDSFVKELSRKNMKVTPYSVDIVKHIIMVSLGVLPGFAPLQNEDLCPLRALQDDFINIYNLKNYAPVIMAPRYFSLSDPHPIYWSLQLPVYFESIPHPRSHNSVLVNLCDIKQLLDALKKSVRDFSIKGVIGTPIEECANKVIFDYFHSDIDPEGLIRPTSEMPKEDTRLIKCPNNYGKRAFSEISPFVRGCIRLSSGS